MQIVLEDVTKRFGATVAVDGLSVTLEAGKLTAVLGPSGCGKTTILNIISGIVPLTSGRVFFNDVDVSRKPPEKRSIGLVFQNYALYPHMTVLQNICFPMEMQKVPKRERLARVEELGELVQIQSLMKRKPSELSGGQQQRVAIARALAKRPEVLLLDEPLSNLDAKLRLGMREEIRRIQRESKITTVFVTHDQEEASSIADDVILLKEGVLQQKAAPRMLYNEPENLFVADFLGTPPINKLAGKISNGQILLDGSEIAFPLETEREMREGQEIVLAVRAESVFAGGEPLFEGTVLERYALGKDELVLFSVGREQQMRGFVSAGCPLQEGEKFPVALRKTGVFLFDAHSGERYA